MLAWLAATAGAQLRVTEHLLIGGGMANNYITDIEEDGRGRIWVATESGLNCYNGFEFQSYNTANSGLNSNMINALYYDAEGDRQGKLWVATYENGIYLFDQQQRLLQHLDRQGGFSSLPYFRSCFKEEYGMTPTEYLKTIK